MPAKKKVAHRHGEEEFHPAEEQGILPDEDSEEEMLAGERDEDIYERKGREKLEEDAEIEPWEEGFMEGASGTGQLGKDALTGEAILDTAVEIEIGGQKYRFASRQNAEKFRKKKISGPAGPSRH